MEAEILPAQFVREPQAVLEFNKQQLDLIKKLIMPGATDVELAFFENICRRTQLDPFARQIYAIRRKVKEGDQWVEKWTPQTSVDGFRLIAERTGKYEGQTETLWCGPDREWVDVWVPDNKYPTAAKAGVYKKGHRAATFAVARWSSYAVMLFDKKTRKETKEPVKMWAKMPDLMLAKCAECLALRKAFPQELSGLYAKEEMEAFEEKEQPETKNLPNAQNKKQAKSRPQMKQDKQPKALPPHQVKVSSTVYGEFLAAIHSDGYSEGDANGLRMKMYPKTRGFSEMTMAQLSALEQRLFKTTPGECQ